MTIVGRGFPKAILFDLDGTLIDSAPDITVAVNELLATRGLPGQTVAAVTVMIGNGVEKLVERAFAAAGQPLAGAELAQALRDMAPIYLRHTTNRTTLLPGVRESLAVLHVRGALLGVVTNKPQAATRQILLHFGLLDLFKAVIGGDAVVAKKPAPDALLLALEKMRVEPADAIMVGDSKADVGAARAAGMPVVLIRGGYTTIAVEDLGADLILDSLDQLPAALRQAEAA
ncbi:MAG TPA: phosphoglycolate phosphatase [Mesorhizobium sp.]